MGHGIIYYHKRVVGIMLGYTLVFSHKRSILTCGFGAAIEVTTEYHYFYEPPG